MNMITTQTSTIGIAYVQVHEGPPRHHLFRGVCPAPPSQPPWQHTWLRGETFTKHVKTPETPMKRLETLETFQETLKTP